MLFKRFYDENLAQASYLVGCERTREALVIDPTLDTAQYVRAAGAERLRIAHVTETHIHADFVSGSASLADASGAKLNLSAEGDGEFVYTKQALKSARPLRDGTRISLGDVVLEALHTPGHTPEHLTFLVSDLARGEKPLGAFTGDFVFVGDVGRPDLLDRAAGATGTMEASARALYRSIREFSRRPDHLQIWPGHGAGSACGKQLGLMPQSTLGYEKLFNWAFNTRSEKEFVRHVLEDQPVPPRYFAIMKKVNRELANTVKPLSPPRLQVGDLTSLMNRTFVVDTRPAERFATAHIPGTLNIPYNKSFLNWCGALVPFDRDVVFILESDADDASSLFCANLRNIGLTRIAGFAGAEVVDEWKSRQGEPEKLRQVDASGAAASSEKSGAVIVDVRAPDEWRKGHLPGALHIPLAALPDRIDEIDADRPVIVHCKGGGRSAIGSSFLQLMGRRDVANMKGGYESWVASGFEVVKDAPAANRRGRSKTKGRKRAATSKRSVRKRASK